jgi:hypothetical protein
MIVPEQLEQAQKMLLMAGKDIKALHALINPDVADDEIFGTPSRRSRNHSNPG